MTDFFLKINSPVLAETPVTQRSPCYSAISSSLMNPLPGYSNYSPFCHTHYLILRIINTLLVSLGQTVYQAAPLETNTSLLQRIIAESSQELMASEEYCSCLEKAGQQAEASGDVPPPPLQIVISIPLVSFSFLSISISVLYLLPFSILSLIPFSILSLIPFSILSLLSFLNSP